VPESSEPDRCRETARSLSSGHPCDVGSLSNGRRILRNGWRHGPQYSDRLSATADQTHLLPSFQPATGPRPVPAPLASELSGIDSHASLGLGAAKLAPPGHRGTFTPIPAGSPALHAASSTTVQRTARRCAGGFGRTGISILGMFSGTAFSPPVVGAMRRIVAHVAPAPGRRHDPTISPYASCCLPARPFPSG
jgi:hypothetical protein